MPKFVYKAVSLDGTRKKALIDANGTEDARLALREKGFFVTSIEEAPERRSRFRMSSRQLGEFFRELSLMLKAGLTLAKALGVSAEGESVSPRVRTLYAELHRLVRGGTALSDAMRQSGAFPEMAVNMVYGGEVGGNLWRAAEKLSENYIAEYKLKKRVAAASAYPKILAALTLGALVIIFSFVLPNILSIIGEQDLPPLTRFMKAVSDYMTTKWYNVVIFALLILAAFNILKRLKPLKLAAHKLILRLFAVGPLLKTVYTARFARSLSSLYGGGVSLVSAIAVSAGAIGNAYLEKQFDLILRRVRQGESMSAALSAADGFDPKLKSLLVIGEETGKLADMLNFAAASFEFDADMAVTSLLAMMEPSLLIAMAAVIGTVVVSVLLPVFQMYGMVGSM